MSAIRSLTGVNRTWSGRPDLVAFDPKRKSPVRNTVQNRKKVPISRPTEKDKRPKVQTDTRRTRLRTCTSNSSSVVSWNRSVIGAALPSRHWSDVCTNHGEGGAFAPRSDHDGYQACGLPSGHSGRAQLEIEAATSGVGTNRTNGDVRCTSAVEG
jgi:hypothetical protein